MAFLHESGLATQDYQKVAFLLDATGHRQLGPSSTDDSDRGAQTIQMEEGQMTRMEGVQTTWMEGAQTTRMEGALTTTTEGNR